MKRKEIEARIKAEAIKEIPDVISRINLENINIEPKKKFVSSFNFARSLKVALTSLVLIFAVIFLINHFDTTGTSTATPLTNDVEILGFQIVSGATLLAEEGLVELSNQVDYNIESLSQTYLSEDSLAIEDYFLEIDPIISLMEKILNQEGSANYQIVESDKDEFEYAINYITSDLSKEELIFKIYYNENPLNGIVEFNDMVYDFTIENNLIKVINSDGDYLTIDNQSDTLQQKFNFSYYKDDSLVQSDLIEIFKVNQALEVKSTSQRNQVVIKLQLQRKYNTNLDELEVDYEIITDKQSKQGNMNVNLEFVQAENRYRYRYTVSGDGEFERPRGPQENPGNNNPGRFN
jgi:hypothetical protein